MSRGRGRSQSLKRGAPLERGCPREGWDEEGGPPSPLSNEGPWGIMGRNKPL